VATSSIATLAAHDGQAAAAEGHGSNRDIIAVVRSRSIAEPAAAPSASSAILTEL